MKKKIELLAPGGDVESIKAAIVAGADAVYCGLAKFNARNRAENIDFDDLAGIIGCAHEYDCEVFLTINIIITANEIAALINFLNKVVNTGIDAVIVQDLGLFYILKNHYKSLVVHASTQMTTHNKGQVELAKILGANRVNLCRELHLSEIADLTSYAHAKDVAVEVFVHGSNCIGFSGLCYFSSVQTGNSGNRGRCSQPCRDQFGRTPMGRDFPLNIKDNSAFFDIADLAEAGVDSLKIEGRIKKSHYVHSVVKTWRKQLQYFYDTGEVGSDNADLYRVFNRDFTNTLLRGSIHREMFIDNPRDNSALHRTLSYGAVNKENEKRAKRELYDEKTTIIQNVAEEIAPLRIDRKPIYLSFSGSCDTPLSLEIVGEKISFTLHSAKKLVPVARKKGEKSEVGQQCFSSENLAKCFKCVEETEYKIAGIDIQNVDDDLFIPFRELRDLGKELFARLRGGRKFQSPVSLPKVARKFVDTDPRLSVLLSSPAQLTQLQGVDADFYLQLPSTLAGRVDEYVDIFSASPHLIPYFPALIMGADYDAAEQLLQKLKPKSVVTNNLGVGRLAQLENIKWIAGPQVNVANHYSMRALQELFGCSGAFVSGELGLTQIGALHGPDGFDLYYSIYNPLLLFSSRQCLVQPVLGCAKESMDEWCLPHCEQCADIQRVKEGALLVRKEKGHFHSLYSDKNFLNLDILTDISKRFSGFLVDFREIETETKHLATMDELAGLFIKSIHGCEKSIGEIKRQVSPTVNTQYRVGM